MDVPQLIDDVCSDFLNVGGDDAADAATRARVLRAAQRFVTRVRNYYNWTWKQGDGTVAITAGSYSGNLPADFQSFGKDGSAVVTSPSPQESPLAWVPGGVIEAAINGNPQSGQIEIYSNRKQSTAGVQVLRVYPAPSVNTTISVTYNTKAPVLVDSVTASVTGLEEIPEDWHPFIYEGVCQSLMKGEGDLRSGGEQAVDLAAWLKEMKRAERAGQEEALFMPRYGGF